MVPGHIIPDPGLTIGSQSWQNHLGTGVRYRHAGGNQPGRPRAGIPAIVFLVAAGLSSTVLPGHLRDFSYILLWFSLSAVTPPEIMTVTGCSRRVPYSGTTSPFSITTIFPSRRWLQLICST